LSGLQTKQPGLVIRVVSFDVTSAMGAASGVQLDLPRAHDRATFHLSDEHSGKEGEKANPYL
jgi:hypothetical protein